MQNSLIRSLSRTVVNTLILGATAAAAIFTVYTLKATGERMLDTLASDISTITNHEIGKQKAA